MKQLSDILNGVSAMSKTAPELLQLLKDIRALLIISVSRELVPQGFEEEMNAIVERVKEGRW